MPIIPHPSEWHQRLTRRAREDGSAGRAAKAIIPLTALRPQMHLEAHREDTHKLVRVPVTATDSLVLRERDAIDSDVQRGEEALRTACTK